MSYLTVRDKGMGQAGGGIVGPAFQLFQYTPIPGLSLPGGYGGGISTPYRPPAQATMPPVTSAPVAPPPQQPPPVQPQPMPQPLPTQIVYTLPQQPVSALPIYAGGGGAGVAPVPTPPPAVTEEATVPVILAEEKPSEFPWWILLAIPAAMLAMKTKK